MYCEKEKECSIYQIHRELNGHYQRLINELVKGCTQRDQMLNAINCNVPHRYIREMVTGKSEEPEKKELLIGAPKEEKQGGKKR